MKPSIIIKINPQANAASYCSVRFFSAVFWGCPALRAGRAVSQLAIRSALRQQAGSVWPAATAIHPSAEALRALAAASPPPLGPKIGYRKKCHGLGTENTRNVS
ncbi:hypothetical protein SapgrDRAFT_2176 [Saprospira grandis DSM 2844]|uniref:Uncharacterized protein n=1 Tax=Saprospira grandis DSM 2844 TaxID=694433 RepID=J0XXN8_9BACT|nr:hypothetical protein SapgrDRAFT_2176 [Saprospira grandis DSM 2844]